jgi:hypothetical protein
MTALAARSRGQEQPPSDGKEHDEQDRTRARAASRCGQVSAALLQGSTATRRGWLELFSQ